MTTTAESYPQVYRNLKVVDGLQVWVARLKGELKRADRDAKRPKADKESIAKRRQHYEAILTHVVGAGRAMASDIDWDGIAPKVSAPEYRTNRSDLRIELIRYLKGQAEPVTLNVIHEAVVAALGLTFTSAKDEKRHRAVVMDALHDLKNGTPSVVETTVACKFGTFLQPEQKWRFRLGPALPVDYAPGTRP